MNKSLHDIGKEYLRSLSSSKAAKEKYRQSLIIPAGKKIVRADYLKDLKAKHKKERTDDEKLEIQIQKTLEDHGLTPAEVRL